MYGPVVPIGWLWIAGLYLTQVTGPALYVYVYKLELYLIFFSKKVGYSWEYPGITVAPPLVVGSNLDAGIKLLYIIFMNIGCGLSYRNLMLF